MAFCGNCGANVPEGNNYCPNCGAFVGNAAGADQTRANENPNYGHQTISGGYRANIKKRDIAVTVILSIVTCGIYGLIWFFNLVNDLNTAALTPNDKTPGMILLLTIVTCGIYGMIWLYNAGDKVDKIRKMNGESSSNSNVLYLVLSIFGLAIVAYCLIQSELNRVAMDA
jgi:hypothetical protein